ncbi:helicase C-terminal domain protein [Coprobacillus sp. CAG:698]|nr:helicase C-terminal domain protein [Coprobacillus sp. CAG:698]
MDKHNLSYYLLDEINNDLFFRKKYNDLLVAYSKSLFNNCFEIYENEYAMLLRYADILSLSDNEKHQNMAQQIVILLSYLFPNEKEVSFFKHSIYINVSNFASVSSFNVENEQYCYADILRTIEIESHKIMNKIPNTDKEFFDAQRIVFNEIESNQFYSFSAPTSMGKTFVITNYIHNKIKNGSKDNFVIVVPTRALLFEIANKVIHEFSDVLGVGKHKIVTAIASLQSKERFIAILTPERFYYALLKHPEFQYGFVFIDEAHKISDKDKRSIIYYKILDMLKERNNVRIYFSSPVIPNPDIYLELTNFYSLSTNDATGQAFEFSPVLQNKICIDLTNKKYSIYNNLSNDIVECGDLPSEITNKMSALLLIGKGKRNLVYVSSAKKAINYAMQLSKLVLLDESKCDKNELEKVAKLIEQKIHKEYYLAKLIRKGIAYHIGALPAEIRLNIEHLIRDKKIQYCFCTSTLLEGVNVPIDNLFIFDYKKASSKMSKIDAFNLMGRVGRITLNELGNVFLFIGEKNEKTYYEQVLLNPLPNQTLLPSDALKLHHKSDIVKILLEGKTNLLHSDEKFKDKKFNESTYEYATKCLNMLLYDICSQNDSYIVRDFRKNKVLSPQNIIDIRERFKSIVSKNDDINLSAMQKKSLYIEIKEHNLNYPDSFVYDDCLEFMRKLSRIFQWNIYEKGTLGKGESINYYTVILIKWMQSSGLCEIIRDTIKYYQSHGGNLVFYEPIYHLEQYDDSEKHKNQLINDVMTDLEQVINYKLSIYFLCLSEAIVEIHGKDALINDWHEYVEYGTCNEYIILLQKYGFLREEALVLLKSIYKEYIKCENKSIHISKKILEMTNDELNYSLKTVLINYPEIFVD